MGKIRYILSSSLRVWISPNGGEREKNNQISWLNGKREFGCQVKAKGSYYDVIVNRKSMGLYRWRKPSMSTCWLVFHSGSPDSLSLSLGKKFEQVCLQHQGNSADSWASVDSGESSQCGWKCCVTGIDFLWGGFSWMIIQWDSHIFRNDLCVIYTDFHGCGLKLFLSFPWTDIYLLIFFFRFVFFFSMCFSQLIQPWILLRELYGTITIWWEK